MTTFKKSFALVASAALAAWFACARAAEKPSAEGEEDLSALLSELEDGDDGAKAQKPAAAPKKAEKPAAAAEAKPAEKAEEPKAAEKTEEPAEAKAEEPKAEEKVEEPAAEKAEEPKAEEKTEEPVEEKAEESDKEAKAEEPAAGEKAEEAKPAEEAGEKAVETSAEEKASDAEAAQAAQDVLKDVQEDVAADAAKAKETTAEEDAAAIAQAMANEAIRRKAHEQHALKLIGEARKLMKEGDYEEAARDYDAALPLLTDTEKLRKFRRECSQGSAEAHYRNALRLWNAGATEDADAEFELAIRGGHPKAKAEQAALKEAAKAASHPSTEIGDVPHVRNEKAYQEKRDRVRGHLRRARQLLGVKDLDEALNECELALVEDPYNQEALRVREQIHAKRQVVLGHEYEITHEAMMADVRKAWRPVYAPNARKIEEVASQTVKAQLGPEDPERAVEQTVIDRMKKMRLPEITFKPPATIIQVVEFFNTTTKDLDRPDLPPEKRGFSFVIHTAKPVVAAETPAEEQGDSDDFSEEAGADEAKADAAATKGMPVIPMISVRDISVHDALQLVCDTIGWKFKVRKDGIVMVMPKSVSTEEMVTRSYPVLSSFMDRMNTASSDIKEFGGGNSSKKSNDKDDGSGEQERDWKEFFTLMGVEWPEGSSIMYIKTIGKLRVKNTYENLAELEKALTELNVDQKLIEIETRFVEVQQDDLNSLGFEWILNSDYSMGLGSLANLGNIIGNGQFKGSQSTVTSVSGYTVTDTTIGGTTTQVLTPITTTTTTESLTSDSGWQDASTTGTKWISGSGDKANLGIASGNMSNGTRYLSETGNYVSKTFGDANSSSNDRFMKLNCFLGNADLSMILHMLSQRSDTDLLSAPKVLTRPGEEAVIKVVTEYIYPTDYDVQLQSSSSSSSSSGSSSQSAILAVVEPQSFTMREVGVILDVTPTLTDDGNLIDLKLSTQVVDEPQWKDYGMSIPYSGNSSMTSFTGIGEIFTGVSEIFSSLGLTLDSSTKQAYAAKVLGSATDAMDSLTQKTNIEYYKAPMEQPWFHLRSIESAISIYPGATIAMGGLITEKRAAMDDKIPFLGDLPFVGRLFRSHAEETQKRNLIIFVTTRLVDVRGRDVNKDTADVKSDADVKAAPEAPADAKAAE